MRPTILVPRVAIPIAHEFIEARPVNAAARLARLLDEIAKQRRVRRKPVEVDIAVETIDGSPEGMSETLAQTYGL